MRRRRSVRASSGTSIRKGRIAVSSATAVAAPPLVGVVFAIVHALLRSTDGSFHQPHVVRDRQLAASPESPRPRAYTTSCAVFRGCQLLIYLCTADHGSLTRLCETLHKHDLSITHRSVS